MIRAFVGRVFHARGDQLATIFCATGWEGLILLAGPESHVGMLRPWVPLLPGHDEHGMGAAADEIMDLALRVVIGAFQRQDH